MAEVIDFGSRRERQGGERAKATAAETSRRLESAGEIAAELRRTHRIALGDRSVLAANLGRMWRGAFPKEAAPPLSKLFETAFGRQGPVQYKKRARFVRFDGEDPDDTLNAHGANYVELAEAIAALAHDGQPADAVKQAKQRAILQLVEGSSFDRRRPPAARLRDEAVATLIDCCDRMVRRVEEAVDLAEMRATLQNDAVMAVIDDDGTVESLHGAAWGRERGQLRESDPHRRLEEALDACSESERMTETFRDDLEALRHLKLQFPNYPLRLGPGDLDLSDPDIDVSERWSRMAPRVVLGEVMTPVEQEAGVVLIDIDEGEIEQVVQDRKVSYGRAIARHGLTDAPAFDHVLARRDLLLWREAPRALARRYGYPDEEIDDKLHTLGALDERIEEDGFAPPRDPWEDKAPLTIWARRRIELQLAFDATTERWRLCLALVPGVGGGTFGPNGGFGSGWDDVYGLYDDESFEPSLNFGWFTEAIKRRRWNGEACSCRKWETTGSWSSQWRTRADRRSSCSASEAAASRPRPSRASRRCSRRSRTARSATTGSRRRSTLTGTGQRRRRAGRWPG